LLRLLRSLGLLGSLGSLGSLGLLDEAAVAAEKNFKVLYNSRRDPITGTIKKREAYHESNRHEPI